MGEEISAQTLSRISEVISQPVVIIGPEIEGQIVEIIVDRNGKPLYKVRYWIDGEATLIVLARDEFRWDEEKSKPAKVRPIK